MASCIRHCRLLASFLFIHLPSEAMRFVSPNPMSSLPCPFPVPPMQCEGKIFWSTFINIDKQQCVRAGSDIQDDQCAVKSEAQFQSRTSFKNNDNINFPSNNKYKGQISAQSVGPQDVSRGIQQLVLLTVV